MKKTISIIFSILIICVFFNEKKCYSFGAVGCTSITGSTGSLDAIPKTKYSNGVLALMPIQDNFVYFYIYDASCILPESLPDIVIPNDNTTGIGAWKKTPVEGSTTTGSSWLFGADVPANELGVVGDNYINTTSYEIYNKTGATTWISIGNIKGEQGIPGTPGSNGVDGATWLFGADVPANELGVVGDNYLNTTSYEIYNKTGATTWTSIGNIKGADGTIINDNFEIIVPNPYNHYQSSIFIPITLLTNKQINITHIKIESESSSSLSISWKLMYADNYSERLNPTLVKVMNTENGIFESSDILIIPIGKCPYIEFTSEPDSSVPQTIVEFTIE